MGVTNHDDRTALKACMSDADTITADVNAILKDLTEFDIESLSDAFNKVVNVIETFPTDFPNCDSIRDDLDKTGNYITSVPLTVAELGIIADNIGLHYEKLVAEAAALYEAFDSK